MPRRLVLTAPGGALAWLEAQELLTALHAAGQMVDLQIALTPDGIDFAVIVPIRDEARVTSHLRGGMPDLEIRPEAHQSLGHAPRCLMLTIGQAGKPDGRPLRDIESFGPIDPLAAVLEAFQPIRRTLDEWGELRASIRAAQAQRVAQAWQHLPFGATRKRITLLEQRLSQPLFDVLVRLSVGGGDPVELRRRASQLAAVFRGRFDASFGGLAVPAPQWETLAPGVPSTWPESDPGMLLSAGELASMFHPPSSDRLLMPGLHYTAAASLLPQLVTERRELPLGTHRQRGQDVPASLSLRDLHHGYLACVGRTGMGKTTLGHQLLRAIARLDPTATIVLFDPHGDWALDFAARSVPAGRHDETYLLELGNPWYPVGIPIFQQPKGLSEETFIETTFSMIKLLFREQWSPTRLESAVYAAVSVLCRLQKATLLDLPRLFTDPLFRHRALQTIGPDRGPREFFGSYEAISPGAQRELIQPILYRLGAFTRARSIRNMTCRTDGVDIEALLDEPSIVLVSAAGAEIRSEADLLLEMLLSRLQLALLGRLGRPGTRRSCYLAIDEAQRMRGASLPILLSEGRKAGLGLLLFSQFVSQWSEALAEAVLGNVTTIVSFAVGPQDSRRLAQSLKPFTADQLEALHAHQAVVRTQIGGMTLPAFDVRTEPLSAAPQADVLERIRQQTRARFTRPRADVERESGDLATPTEKVQETDDVYED
jgi:hypothetical protein